MSWSKLTDSEWDSIKGLFPPACRVGRPPTCRRKSTDAILWVLYHDAPWRNLPKEFGAWRTIYGLCQAWIANGTLHQVIQELQFDIPPGKGELVAQGNADAARAREDEAVPVGAVEDGAVPVGEFEDGAVPVGAVQDGTSDSNGRFVDEDDSDVRSEPAVASGVFDDSDVRAESAVEEEVFNESGVRLKSAVQEEVFNESRTRLG